MSGQKNFQTWKGLFRLVLQIMGLTNNLFILPWEKKKSHLKKNSTQRIGSNVGMLLPGLRGWLEGEDLAEGWRMCGVGWWG